MPDRCKDKIRIIWYLYDQIRIAKQFRFGDFELYIPVYVYKYKPRFIELFLKLKYWCRFI